MSDFERLTCPRCGKGSFHLDLHGHQVKATCRHCLYWVGTAEATGFAGANLVAFDGEKWTTRTLSAAAIIAEMQEEAGRRDDADD